MTGAGPVEGVTQRGLWGGQVEVRPTAVVERSSPAAAVQPVGRRSRLWTCSLRGNEGSAQRERRCSRLERDRAARRRRGLHRESWVWAAELRGRCLPRRGVLLATFTLRSADPDGVELDGSQRAFWHAFLRRFPGVAYFAWMEVQRRGVVHYHAILADPPGGRDGLTGPWMTHQWAVALGVADRDCNVDLSWRAAHKLGPNPMDYAMGYAKKRGAKAYQQDYAEAPVGLRTFMHPRLTVPAAKVAKLSGAAAEFLADLGAEVVSAKRASGGGVDVTATVGGRRRRLVIRDQWQFYASSQAVTGAGPPPDEVCWVGLKFWGDVRRLAAEDVARRKRLVDGPTVDVYHSRSWLDWCDGEGRRQSVERASASASAAASAAACAATSAGDLPW